MSSAVQRVLTRFKMATLVTRVATRFAMEFPTEDALHAYLKKHPKAKPANHSVKGQRDKAAPPAEHERAPAKKERATVPKKRPPKTTGPETASQVEQSGVGRGTGAIELKGSTAQVRQKYDADVEKSKPDRTDTGSGAHTVRLMEKVGASEEEIQEVRKWSRKWTAGEMADDARSVSSETMVSSYLGALEKPDSWARKHYEATQACLRAQLKDLKARGVMDDDGFVTLYRGVHGDQAKELREQYKDLANTHELDIEVRGLSSWSESPAASEEFADDEPKYSVILEQKVHFSRIAAMWQTEYYGWAYSEEFEWSVLGSGDGKASCTLHSKQTLAARKAKYEKPPKSYSYF